MTRRSTFVTVAAFINPWDAYIAKGRLETEGITVFIAHEYHIWANWVYSQALGGVKLQVRAEDAEAAAKIISAHLQGDFEAELPDELQSTEVNACPHCGSMDYRSHYPLAMVLLVILTLGLLAIIFPLRKERHRCSRCGHVWKF